MIEKTIHTSDDCRFSTMQRPQKKQAITRPANKKQTMFFDNPPVILCGSAIGSSMEQEGPIGKFFDVIEQDSKLKKDNFENAEIAMLENAIDVALTKANMSESDLDLLVAGDLLNQITTSNYCARGFKVPYIGLYSACSTMTEALAIAASLISGGFFKNIACATASHFATAERQFRYPLEYGSQRPAYAQWTVTGAGCSILSASGNGPKITSATIGKVTDFGVTDLSNMGAAMAPAAMDTMLNLLHDTQSKVEDYDLILTGDLGKLGSDILRDLMMEQGHFLAQQYIDCGSLIYSYEQNCYQGGSGAGCSATVFNSYILNKLNEGCYKKIMFLATGALMSTQSCNQGESIPCISHGVVIEA